MRSFYHLLICNILRNYIYSSKCGVKLISRLPYKSIKTIIYVYGRIKKLLSSISNCRCRSLGLCSSGQMILVGVV
ncbi:hypothetical protein HZS_6261 [Henneguya salminicola]|nr:hypothetical protein HZS_6261 [Henneguya salminicola]